jgi:hypothetical protein
MKWTILIFHPNLRQYTKTLFLSLLCTTTFRGRHKDRNRALRLLGPALSTSVIIPLNTYLRWVPLLQKAVQKTFDFGGQKTNLGWLQASAAMLMRSALFCDITQRRVVILYRRFGTTYRSHLQRSRSLDVTSNRRGLITIGAGERSPQSRN